MNLKFLLLLLCSFNLFSNEKITDVLDHGNKYFYCTLANFKQIDYKNFTFHKKYIWHGKITKFHPELVLPKLAVSAYLAIFDQGDANSGLSFANDLVNSDNGNYRATGYKLAAYVYSHYIDPRSQDLAKTLAANAIKEGSKTDFLKIVEEEGIFPRTYCN